LGRSRRQTTHNIKPTHLAAACYRFHRAGDNSILRKCDFRVTVMCIAPRHSCMPLM
jgi:hypothetical protein